MSFRSPKKKLPQVPETLLKKRKNQVERKALRLANAIKQRKVMFLFVMHLT